MWSVLVSWLAVLAFAAAATSYYNPRLFKSLWPQTQSQQSSDTTSTPRVPVKKPKQKRTLVTRVDSTEAGNLTPTSSNEGTKSKKRKIVSAPLDASVTVKTVDGKGVDLPRDDDGTMSNKYFAQQLAKAQAGTQLDSGTTQSASLKSRAAQSLTPKYSNTKNESSGMLTDNSSTTGRDADDDLSPDASPASRPISTAPTSRAGDISDMLEPSPAKPTSLRLTNISVPAKRETSKTASKTFEPVLTKKQRQRQARQEEQRLMREESDRIHDAKKQAQLHAARMAAGTSNQTRANAFVATQNPWQGEKSLNQSSIQKPPSTTSAGLLDTLKEEKSRTPTNGTQHAELQTYSTSGGQPNTSTNNSVNGFGENKTNVVGATNSEKVSRPKMSSQSHSSWADQVTEEEQNDWVNQLVQEEKWESVTKKKSKKKAKQDNETSSEASSTFARPLVPPAKVLPSNVQSNGIKSRPENLNRFHSMENIGGTDLGDGDWEP